MIHRESGLLKTTYQADMALYPLPVAKWAVGTQTFGSFIAWTRTRVA